MCLIYACIVSMFCPSIIQCSVKKKKLKYIESDYGRIKIYLWTIQSNKSSKNDKKQWIGSKK